MMLLLCLELATYRLELDPIQQNGVDSSKLVATTLMMKNSKRTPKGKFQNGSSGNPAGRPRGSRNKATLICEQLLEGEAPDLIRILIEKAKGGSIQALGMCLDRLLPARKERYINLEPRSTSSPEDLRLQFQDLTKAVSEGQITPGEGESFSNILTNQAKTMQLVEVLRRLPEIKDKNFGFSGSMEELLATYQGIMDRAKPDEKANAGEETRAMADADPNETI